MGVSGFSNSEDGGSGLWGPFSLSVSGLTVQGARL